MLVLDTTNCGFALKDAVHAMDKDTRSLFAFDNRKNDKKKNKNTEIPELRLLSYYADITGPKELHLKNYCTKLIESHLQTTYESLFKHCSMEIMYISHYSFEFVINITNNTLFLDHEHKFKLDTDTDTDSSINRYLVGAYQQSSYDIHKDEFLTIGVTSSIGNSLNNQLYNFYIDDFIQDLYKIVCNHCAWYDSTCELPNALWQCVARYTIDCILPVAYTRSDAEQILLNDGQLFVFLDEYLSEYHMHQKNININDGSGDMPMNNNNDNEVIDDKLIHISQIFVEIGRIIDKEYHSDQNKKAAKLKSEYDKWKKKGFKKRASLKPLNMNRLVQQLKQQQHKRSLAKDIDSINELQHLYFINPNFKIKRKSKSKRTMQSIKKLFNYSQSDQVTGNDEEKHFKEMESAIMTKIKQEIGSAYKEYKREKGKIPSDIQAFVNYCKKKKNIKKANWALCQSVIKQFETNLNSVQE